MERSVSIRRPSSGWPAGYSRPWSASRLLVAALYVDIVSFRKSQYKGDIEYWRDLPDLSPAAAAKMEDIMSASSSILGSGKTKNADKLANRQMSSTVMSLASKGAIAIYPGPVDLYNGIDLTTTSAASVAGMLGSNGAPAANEEDQHHRYHAGGA